ncbi:MULTISPECIES: hypothetical protein [Clavibacter]|uniref:Uncharacterized protein n=2 Tax=Clavibacter TaxID=1573 RepID=A0A399NR67_9MICO|nr:MULTISPECIES: hypothetical protein [Clavibacter]KDP92222.1 hypothetical protein W824_04355 [Clavibacter cf. michiganensis LMG 26808]RII96371.1 hypothetical protein DZF96_11650 [Clavibacter michiganensis]UKF24809.1 hypothetical protein KYT88_14000 [Clavibacter sp. A6099]
MSQQQTAHRPSLAGPDPIRQPYDARLAMILLVTEGLLAFAGLIAMVVASWTPAVCAVPGCDYPLGELASRLWVVGTISVLVLSIIATVVCRTRRVNAWWAPATGIVLIIGINVAAQIMTRFATMH